MILICLIWFYSGAGYLELHWDSPAGLNKTTASRQSGPGMVERMEVAGRCAVAVVAKAPLPGRSKTRLCPPLRPEQAAALSGAFLRDMCALVQEAARLEAMDLFVAYAPAAATAALTPHVPVEARLMVATGETVTEPGVTGFGQVLLETMRGMFALGYGAGCVLNSDSPTLPAAVLARAARELREPETAVLGPTGDGGYYLLGLTRPAPSVFADVAWSTDSVATRTRQQAAAAGLRVVTLPTWDDVDDAAGLEALRRELAAGGAAPATRMALTAMGLLDAARLETGEV